MNALSFPPLFKGEAVTGQDPFETACARAQAGCDAGLVVYQFRPDMLRAAIVFAPEVPLREAAIILPICAIGFQNALGALAPPEVAVHLEWGGNIRVNGGIAGTLRAAAPTTRPEAEPDWLVVALDLAIWPADEETGLTPDVTALFTEGCADVEAPALLEAWTRHSLVWINRWQDEGPRPIHSEWLGLGHGLQDSVTFGSKTGTFAGVDENFGMILQSGKTTAIIPLTDMISEAP